MYFDICDTLDILDLRRCYSCHDICMSVSCLYVMSKAKMEISSCTFLFHPYSLMYICMHKSHFYIEPINHSTNGSLVCNT